MGLIATLFYLNGWLQTSIMNNFTHTFPWLTEINIE